MVSAAALAATETAVAVRDRAVVVMPPRDDDDETAAGETAMMQKSSPSRASRARRGRSR